MSTLLWITTFGFLMSLIALVGSLTLVFPHLLVERTLLAMVAFGAGSLLGGAVLHMIPAAVEKMGNTTELYVWFLAGFVLFLALEQFLMWHHSHTHSHYPTSAAPQRHSMSASCMDCGVIGVEGVGEAEGSCMRNRTELFQVMDAGTPGPVGNDDTLGIGDESRNAKGDGARPLPLEQRTQSEDEESRSGRVNPNGDPTPSPLPPPISMPKDERQSKKPLTYLILIADMVHNFIGGLFVGASFVDSTSLGLSAWLAAAAHEVPQELGDFAILIHGGWSGRSALLWNFLSALTFPLGGFLAYYLSEEQEMDVSFLIPFAAGNFVYIGATDLIPEIKHFHGVQTNLIYFSSFLLGITMLLIVRIVVDGW